MAQTLLELKYEVRGAQLFEELLDKKIKAFY